MNAYDVTPGNSNGNKPTFQSKLKDIFDKIKAFILKNKALSIGIVAGVLILSIGLPVILSSAARTRRAELGDAFARIRNEFFNLSVTDPNYESYNADVNYTIEIKTETKTTSGSDVGETSQTMILKNQSGKLYLEIQTGSGASVESYIWKDGEKYYMMIRTGTSQYSGTGENGESITITALSYLIQGFWKDGEKYYKYTVHADMREDTLEWELQGSVGRAEEISAEQFETFAETLNVGGNVGNTGVSDSGIEEFFKYSGGKYVPKNDKAKKDYSKICADAFNAGLSLNSELRVEYDISDIWYTVKNGRIYEEYAQYRLVQRIDGDIVYDMLVESKSTYTYSFGDAEVNVPDLSNISQ